MEAITFLYLTTKYNTQQYNWQGAAKDPVHDSKHVTRWSTSCWAGHSLDYPDVGCFPLMYKCNAEAVWSWHLRVLFEHKGYVGRIAEQTSNSNRNNACECQNMVCTSSAETLSSLFQVFLFPDNLPCCKFSQLIGLFCFFTDIYIYTHRSTEIQNFVWVSIEIKSFNKAKNDSQILKLFYR